MSYGTPTTRRHPRSLREAWPREHANPVEHFRRPGCSLTRIGICLSALILIGALAALGA